MSEPSEEGDSFVFHSSYSQFVHINVVPVHMLSDFSLILKCSPSKDVDKIVIASACSNPFLASGGLADFIVVRLQEGEECEVVVTPQQGHPNGIYGWGYYLYVTGTLLQENRSNGSPLSPVMLYSDLWAARSQSDFAPTFNILGGHQMWKSFRP